MEESPVVALVVVSTFVVLVFAVLVAGLLRSHADILRSLHELGVGVGDPATSAAGATTALPTPTTAPTGSLADPPAPSSAPGLGPAPTVAGVTPSGDARAVAVDNNDGLTLLGFLSSGCATCAGFWDALQSPDLLDLPEGTRVAIVTKGPDREVPSEVRALTTGRVPVVMSTDAWLDYKIPGSPFFVLVDGTTGYMVGQGVARHVGQLAELIRRAEHDRSTDQSNPRRRRREPEPEPDRLDGPARAAAADDVLQAAGIHPGDPSLYPTSLEDVFPFGSSAATQTAGIPSAQAD
jgi:hypothetical protein